VRIGFDAKRYFENRTGLGSFSRTLINNLIKFHPEHEYILYTNKKPNTSIENNLDLPKIKIRYPKIGLGAYYRSRGILKDIVEDQLDIYHGLSNELPFGIHKTHVKSVVTIHDLLFKDFPEDYMLVDRMVYDWKSSYACKNADKIVAISKATQVSIMKHYTVPAHNISVIYQDINPTFYERTEHINQKQVLAQLQIDEDYILFVGNDSKRKNLTTVLNTLKYLECDLVLVLNSRKLNKECRNIIRNENLDSRIKIFSNLTADKLKVLYSNAKCLVYPSLGEGWGLPIEEAIACMTISIVPDNRPFTELPSTAKIFVSDPKNALELAKRIKNLSTKKHDIDKENGRIPEKNAEYLQLYENILYTS